MKIGMMTILILIGLFAAGTIVSAAVAISEETAECIDCHASIHPGIVKDWQNSRHAMVTPQKAMAVEGVARKVSSRSVPEGLQNVVVGCAECHTQRPKAHKDTFDHNGYDIHVVVSPDDCQTCHVTERTQYAKNIMAHAYGNLTGNKLHQKFEHSILAAAKHQNGELKLAPANGATKAEACYYCHGTKLEVSGYETRDTEAAGELEFPIIKGWPNQGVGRINLDGSMGACSACHTRHAFSIEMARKPYTCKECHVGPDVPAFKVYAASKHGNIFATQHSSWDFKAVPWTIGKDFTAPTCATCHVSLLVNTDEEVVVERTHQMNNRLPWRLLGLIYAHPHPAEPNTSIIRNKDGLPLPTDFAGGLATKFLIDEKEQNARRQAMQAACLNCHDTSWVNGHWKRFENTIAETNAQTLAATGIMEDIWQHGFADPKDSPYNEAIERKWSESWLFYANTIRFASAMGGGGDYGVFADGRYHLSKTLLELNDWLKLQKKLDAASKK
ncbi:MAG: multiheme c-type cytochrome [Desulfobacterales bacterium]|nr:multiheme c-type cytochrome [Desulfobacterales bacterium]